MSIAPGTWVKFTADARLRNITKEGLREQAGMHEGAMIGEVAEAVVVQKIGHDAFTVVFPEQNLFGWVYAHEAYVSDPRRPLEKLDFVKVR